MSSLHSHHEVRHAVSQRACHCFVTAVHNLSHNRGRLALAALLVVVGLAVSARPALADESTAVGRISLVLGKAYIESSAADRQSIKVGDPVRVGDSIVTEANGHVHVEFDDKALVSVRPLSQLEIVRYDYDVTRPEQSSVKFNLVEGVTRAISGEAAKNARQRFRLNTPIAAIGVRGTDFVVRASDQSVRALVNEGAIVMAPYSIDCSADDFGPCATNAVELTQNDMQIVELDGSGAQPRVLTATLEREPELMPSSANVAVAAVQTNVSAEDKSAETDVYLETVTSRRVTDEVAAVKPPATRPTPVPDFTPDTQVSAAILTSRQLVWGHYGAGLGSAERITLDFPTVSQQGVPSVGSTRYILFRDEGGRTTVDRGLGPVSFALNSAQAFYDAGSGAVAMQVNSGKLAIDFDTNTFATELNLNHSATGKVDLIAAGKLLDGGYFNSRSDTQVVAGAVSLDGREAGYFFEKQLEAGGIQGLTLWNR